MRTGVSACIWRDLAFAPQERLRLNLLSALFASSEVERLQMNSETLIAFFGNCQIGNGGFEVRLARRLGRSFQKKACNWIIDRHKDAISRPGGFEHKPWRESEWVEQPASQGRVERKPSGNDSFFQRRCEPRKRTRLRRTHPWDVRLVIHILSIHPLYP